MANLASNLVETASGLGDSVALRVGQTATTCAELDQASSRVAGMLRERGLKPGDPVGIMLPNVAEFAVIYYGVLRAGCAVVPMNPLGAAVVLKPGADVTAEELRDHVKAQVAAYKYPRKVWLVNELPKGRPERSSNVRSFLRATRAREKSEVYGLLLDGDNR